MVWMYFNQPVIVYFDELIKHQRNHQMSTNFEKVASPLSANKPLINQQLANHATTWLNRWHISDQLLPFRTEPASFPYSLCGKARDTILVEQL